MGSSVDLFERKIGKLFSKKFSLMVNSGSSALTLAMNVLNLKKGDEVITPCLNFGTAVSAILLSGAKPKFIDVDIESLQINVENIKKNISKKTKAILVPNLIGNIPDWEKSKNFRFAKKISLKVGWR